MFEQKKFMQEEDDIEFFPLMPLQENPDESKIKGVYDSMPVMPLRNSVLFPGVIIPITVAREKSIKALNAANKSDKLLAVVAQINPDEDDASLDQLYQIGTVARIIRSLKMPDGTTTIIIQGKKRIRINNFHQSDPYITAEVEVIEEPKRIKKDKEFSALLESLKEMSANVVRLSPQIPNEAEMMVKNIENDNFLVHFIASNLNIPVDQKQKILATQSLKTRAEMTLNYLSEELQMVQLKDKIQSKVKTDIEKQQRDYFLHQQMKTIQEELGGEGIDHEIQEMIKRAKTKKWPENVQTNFNKEINKIKRVNPAAAEYSVLMNYLELMLDLPWEEYSEDNFDLHNARKVLNSDHYGLEKIKERILEYLAVLKLKGDMKSPILCFVGPPGVGKTSLGKSIANALNRKYVRMSLGGLHDESEIRGHRKTYIGAMPGRIIQSIKKAKNSNPVFILDEIDKVGNSFRGDPSSALLEVLDPEQNETFYDNYLELEYDLSKVMFIATANNLQSIQPALRDRMEIISLSGYSVEEKAEIAIKHLIPKQRKAHGLKKLQVDISKSSLVKLIEEYTLESGVRNLDRQIASIMRWVAKNIAFETEYDVKIKPERIPEILGKPKVDKEKYLQKNPAGVAIGLAYTVVGGDILFIETSLHKGKGSLTLTGNLGDVMKESATTAVSFIKANAEKIGIDPEVFKTTNIHIHVPEGAIPKDGPSAGVTLMTALTSALTNKKLKPNLAMSGEITLRGKVLPVGGIKEKTLAAKRAGIKNIILSKKNEKDVEEINENYLRGVKFFYVDEMIDVLDLALER